MVIKLAKNAGFCSGVKSAVDKALECSVGTKVFGEIIHNENVCNYLKNRGIETVYDLSEIKPDDTVLIRTH